MTLRNGEVTNILAVNGGESSVGFCKQCIGPIYNSISYWTMELDVGLNWTSNQVLSPYAQIICEDFGFPFVPNPLRVNEIIPKNIKTLGVDDI